MKILQKALIVILCLFSSYGLHAQRGSLSDPVIPFQQNKSILFGLDKFINDIPQQDQKNIAICSAFNGWLYATYSYFNDSVNQDAVAILRSKDNGINWSILYDYPMGLFDVTIIKLNILACGHDTDQLKVFIGIHRLNTTTLIHGFSLSRLDKNGVPEDDLYRDVSGYIKDFEIASDDLYPASNSNPFSIGLVYSKETAVGDSIVFWSSSDGGMSMMVNHHSIAHTSKHFHKVALSYGRSPTWSSGRYFAAWEEKDNENSVSGHIYTAHSEPGFNSSFTIPVILDTLDATSANNASNPVISCQNNNADNDSSNLTEVILYDKYIPSTHKYNIGGFYNKKATTSNSFHKLTIDPSANNKLQRDICFNAYDSTFIVTYFDSTAQKLPYYIHDYNMTDPDAWTGLSAGYNDYNNLVAPHPQVVMDFEKRAGMNAWIGVRGAGNGVAEFDSPFTWYVGYPEINTVTNQLKVKVYPNPANNQTFIEYSPPKDEVQINILNSVGQFMDKITVPEHSTNYQTVKVDLLNYVSGVYIFTLRTGNINYSGKIVVIK